MKIKWIAANLVLAAALVIVLAPSAFAQEPEHQHHHDGAENLGTVNFPVLCATARNICARPKL
jgi:hypothetical protein